MKYLLDTHTFLWFITQSRELSVKAESIIRDGENDIQVSMASFWEISIKNSLGKLPLDEGYDQLSEHLGKNDFELLNITYEHTRQQNQLPFIHRDPFDRMIVSQALAAGMDLISKDEILDGYFEGMPVKRVW
ncbi:MAG: type II toxin-antitoxin system VapC family toxin [Saprospiraceae bacterium]